MATTSPLLDLPAELIEEVVKQLDYFSICQLRLVCKEAAKHTELGLVKKDFATRRLTVADIERLEELAVQTNRSWKTCRLSGLTFYAFQGIERNRQFLEHSSKVGDLLQKIFTGIRKNGRTCTFRLTVDFRQPMTWCDFLPDDPKAFYVASVLTCALIFNGLEASGLIVRNLELFTGETWLNAAARQGVSLLGSCYVGKPGSLYGLTDLTLGLQSIQRIEGAQSTPLKDSPLAALITESRSLTSLNIRLHTGKGLEKGAFEEGIRLSVVMRMNGLPKLQSLTLRGMYFDEKVFMNLISPLTELQFLKLDSLHFDGSVVSIMEFLTGAEQLDNLRQIQVSYIYDADSKSYFDTHPCTRPYSDPSKMIFAGSGRIWFCHPNRRSFDYLRDSARWEFE